MEWRPTTRSEIDSQFVKVGRRVGGIDAVTKEGHHVLLARLSEHESVRGQRPTKLVVFLNVPREG